MIFRNLVAGDWTFGAGRGDYAINEAAIDLNIQTRLLIFLGEVFWALQAGVDWWNILGAKNPGAQAAAILQTRSIIAQSYGVVEVVSVNPVFTAGTRQLTVQYTVNTIFTKSVTGSVSVP